METFKQVRDLLIWVRNLHGRMKEAYRDAAGKAPEGGRPALLFLFLEQHEGKFENSIAEAVSNHDDILDTWIQYTPDKELLESFQSFTPSPDMDVDAVAETARKMGDALVQFFRDTLERVDSEPVRDVFEQLVKKQETDRAELAQHLDSVHRDM